MYIKKVIPVRVCATVPQIITITAIKSYRPRFSIMPMHPRIWSIAYKAQRIVTSHTAHLVLAYFYLYSSLPLQIKNEIKG